MKQDVACWVRRPVLHAGLLATALGVAGGAQAAATVTGFEALLGGAGGTLDSFGIDNTANTIDLAKTFTTIAPLTLRITVGHGTGSGGPLTVTESITNNTGQDWTDYHYELFEPGVNQGVVFSAFQQSTLQGFDLEDAPASGPRNLDFLGSLATGALTNALFALSLPDPGAGNSYTFDLTQTPTIDGGPGPGPVVPLPPTAWLLGSAIVGLTAARRRRSA
ncbi:MAG: pyruvate-binding protein [Acidobacteria bacterium]|nr:pyruvate-binding protein [Acidobacteriota bacterium]